MLTLVSFNMAAEFKDGRRIISDNSHFGLTGDMISKMAVFFFIYPLLDIELHGKRFVKCIKLKYHGFREPVLQYLTPFWLLIFSRKSDFNMSYSRIIA